MNEKHSGKIKIKPKKKKIIKNFDKIKTAKKVF